MSEQFVKWMRKITERFHPWPSSKRVEKDSQKVVEGTAPRPRQDVFEDE